MVLEDRLYWEKFRNKKRNTLTHAEYEKICKLHSDYMNHSFWKPCTCSPKTINQWISDLNDIYDMSIALMK